MWSLFGSKKTQQNSSAPVKQDTQSTAEVIQRLKADYERLEKREAHQQQKIDALVKEAQMKGKNKDKKGALFALQKKKLIESEIQSNRGVMMNISTQINTLEAASIQSTIFNSQTQAKNQLNKMKQGINSDKVEDLMDDMRDLMDDNQQVQEALGRQLVDQDEDELNDELDDLLNDGELDVEEIKEDSPSVVVPNVPDGPILPNVPTGDVTVQHKSDEDKAIADLMAEMN